MKKYILGLILAVCFFASQAQVSFGVKGGLNFSNVAYSGTYSSVFSDTDNLLGLHFGLYGKLKLKNNFSLITEIQFSQKGYKGLTGNTKEKININYIEIPILYSYSINRLGVDLGLSPAFLASSSTPIIGSFKSFDANIIGGIRFHLTENIFMTTRYYYGLTSISDIVIRDINVNVSTVTTFNRLFQFSIGYKIK